MFTSVVHEVPGQCWTLEHPTKARCYRFALTTTGRILYQCWEGRTMTLSVVLDGAEARRRWKYLTKVQGYSEIGAMSKGLVA